MRGVFVGKKEFWV